MKSWHSTSPSALSSAHVMALVRSYTGREGGGGGGDRGAQAHVAHFAGTRVQGRGGTGGERLPARMHACPRKLPMHARMHACTACVPGVKCIQRMSMPSAFAWLACEQWMHTGLPSLGDPRSSPRPPTHTQTHACKGPAEAFFVGLGITGCVSRHDRYQFQAPENPPWLDSPLPPVPTPLAPPPPLPGPPPPVEAHSCKRCWRCAPPPTPAPPVMPAGRLLGHQCPMHAFCALSDAAAAAWTALPSAPDSPALRDCTAGPWRGSTKSRRPEGAWQRASSRRATRLIDAIDGDAVVCVSPPVLSGSPGDGGRKVRGGGQASRLSRFVAKHFCASKYECGRRSAGSFVAACRLPSSVFPPTPPGCCTHGGEQERVEVIAEPGLEPG